MKPEYRLSFSWDAIESDPMARWGKPVWDLLINKLRKESIPSGTTIHVIVRPEHKP